MDLGAYSQIEKLNELATKNGIAVPRLRGYRLMANEEKIDIREAIYENNLDGSCCKDLCRSIPFWSPNSCISDYSSYTDSLVKYYTKKVHSRIEPRWERIHGWKRRVLKTYIHNTKKRYEKNFEVFNKYAGRKDILYIHARIGGGNWPSYYKEVINQPWFIEKIDDPFDATYCDIYAKLTKLPKK